jgi:cold shock protein
MGMNCKVKWWSDSMGYGFLTSESGKDIFVHYSVIDDTNFKTLLEGSEVVAEVYEGTKGLYAQKVKKL